MLFAIVLLVIVAGISIRAARKKESDRKERIAREEGERKRQEEMQEYWRKAVHEPDPNAPRTDPEPKPVSRQERRSTSKSWIDAQAEMLRVDRMGGTEFEHWFAGLLRDYGFISVNVMGKSGDMGGDVVAEGYGDRWAFQCKRWENKVGRSAVSDALGAKGLYSCNRAVAVTNNYFQPAAIKLANANGVELWDRDKLVGMIGEINNGREKPYMIRLLESMLWPESILTNRIDYDYYDRLPFVPKMPGVPEAVKCYPIGGYEGEYDPYKEWEQGDDPEFLVVEFCCDEFKTEEEARHFMRAVEKRYYVKFNWQPSGVVVHRKNGMDEERYNVSGFAIGDVIKHRFSPKGFYWMLETWAQ